MVVLQADKQKVYMCMNTLVFISKLFIYDYISTCFICVYVCLYMRLSFKDKILFVSVISLIGTRGGGSLKPFQG